MQQETVTVCFLVLCHMYEPVPGGEQVSLLLVIYLAQQIFLDYKWKGPAGTLPGLSQGLSHFAIWLQQATSLLLTNVRKALLLGNAAKQERNVESKALLPSVFCKGWYEEQRGPNTNLRKRIASLPVLPHCVLRRDSKPSSGHSAEEYCISQPWHTCQFSWQGTGVTRSYPNIAEWHGSVTHQCPRIGKFSSNRCSCQYSGQVGWEMPCR